VAAAAILALSSGLAVTQAGPNKNVRVSGTPPQARAGFGRLESEGFPRVCQ
jgi:hypothetical protein